jgi:class 3 adenylate cyclase
VAKPVEDDPDKVTLEKRPSNVSILLVDIQGFSRITENFGRRLVNDMVERHFSRYLD